jgi:hypothetical protein
MNCIITKLLVAVVALVVGQGVLANGLLPYNVHLDCDPALSHGNPPLEPLKGKSQTQVVYLGNETFCYRIKFKCGGELYGGLDLGCFCDPSNPEADGGAGGGFWIETGEYPNNKFCTAWFAHVRNNEFSHTCNFDEGDVRIRVEAAEGQLCSDLPDPVFPDP